MKMATADRLSAVAFLALGLAMLAGGWSMDRLEIRRIHPASIPGLVPMILGALLALCALLLWRGAAKTDGAVPLGSLPRLGLALALTLVYALLLVGQLPFFWATAIFVAAFAAAFTWRGLRPLALAGAVAYGLGAAAAISALFERVFLVRLP